MPKVTVYSYRTARVNSEIQMDRSIMCELEDRLATEAGVTKDNHTVYVVEGANKWNESAAFWFTDFKCIMGSEKDLVVKSY